MRKSAVLVLGKGRCGEKSLEWVINTTHLKKGIGALAEEVGRGQSSTPGRRLVSPRREQLQEIGLME